jgi:hypothetical protein
MTSWFRPRWNALVLTIRLQQLPEIEIACRAGSKALGSNKRESDY